MTGRRRPRKKTKRTNDPFHEFIKQILDRTFEQMHNPAPALTDEDMDEYTYIPPPRIKQLLMLCHPDKHGNAQLATEVTQWLLNIRQRENN